MMIPKVQNSTRSGQCTNEGGEERQDGRTYVRYPQLPVVVVGRGSPAVRAAGGGGGGKEGPAGAT
jgi:hypothetical protein